VVLGGLGVQLLRTRGVVLRLQVPGEEVAWSVRRLGKNTPPVMRTGGLTVGTTSSTATPTGTSAACWARSRSS